jgi:hypothetical protein
MPLWFPQPEWTNQPAYLIGGGSSLKGFDFGRLTGRNVIGCNEAFRLGKDIVKICLFGDHAWYQRRKAELALFGGKVVSCVPSLTSEREPWLLQMGRVREGLPCGNNLGWYHSTGAAAITLAILLGADPIYLLGYDVCLGPGGDSHWHNQYNPVPEAHRLEAYERFLQGFRTLAKHMEHLGISVLNVTNGMTRLTGVWPCIGFDEFYVQLDQKDAQAEGRVLAEAGK